MNIPPAKQQLIDLSRRLLKEVKDHPMGEALEIWLNATYPASSDLYRQLASLVKTGMTEGWACRDEIRGPDYRRSQIAPPSLATFGFSIESVYMREIVGREHEHPNGEVNMIVPLDAGARVGEVHAGWTCPAPRSQHFPEVHGGAVIFLYYLPGGEIRFTGR
ncbi:4-hydroxylaminobenzoate lyase [Variovorax sp. JS1663]|uniref:4-hydroxylaminobenzoate lyase n=1 Tax=Variovorax sp. JS1663 TaxID=1851577 RepID=UPI000B347262|nr:DUF4863 family protein [Variovorax sp. JS1663]OUL99575.1 hypothetical protein A8M77_25430 [Variovorax sp. JS1663]